MDAAEIFDTLQRMFAAMEKMCIRTTEMRERYGRWNVPVTKAECTVIWFALGVKPEPGAYWPRFPVPNATELTGDPLAGRPR